MSDLQLGLLVIGAVAIVAVVAYNKRQESRYRREAEASFRSSHEDVLMRGGPGRVTQDAPAHSHASERIEPVLRAEPPGRRGAAAAPTAAPASASGLSEAVDYVVAVQAADGIVGDAALAAADGALARCTKAIQWEGFNEADARWEPLRADHGYAMLRAGLQMVDRHGVVGADELAAFGAGMQDAAAQLGATATIPETVPVLARAAELDRFCSEVDIQIALNLVAASAAFAGAKLRSLAESERLLLEADGKFRRRDAGGRVLFELANLEPNAFREDAIGALSTRGLTVLLDVPRAPGREGTFDEFTHVVQRLARALGATLVDDNGRPLAASAFPTIRSQLRGVYEAMEARGIAAGSGLALRLFS
jgi:FtsZ-interacting cell division protein ZipA